MGTTPITLDPAEVVAVYGRTAQTRANIERLANALSVLISALCYGDLVSARYAAATITERADAIECGLIALDQDARIAATRAQWAADHA